jgi:anti-sigma factor RsiW
MANESTLSEDDRSNLVAYLDGELDEKKALALEAKLGINSTARLEADKLKRIWELLDYLPRPAASGDFTHRTMERISAVPGVPRSRWQSLSRWRPLAGVVGWAAALLVASALGFAGARLLAPSTRHGDTAAAVPLDPEAISRDRRVIENRRLYENMVSLEFLRQLANPDDPDLFSDENAGS